MSVTPVTNLVVDRWWSAVTISRERLEVFITIRIQTIHEQLVKTSITHLEIAPPYNNLNP